MNGNIPKTAKIDADQAKNLVAIEQTLEGKPPATASGKNNREKNIVRKPQLSSDLAPDFAALLGD
jgi:hypothetical protein